MLFHFSLFSMHFAEFTKIGYTRVLSTNFIPKIPCKIDILLKFKWDCSRLILVPRIYNFCSGTKSVRKTKGFVDNGKLARLDPVFPSPSD